jgi:heme/copper-type cytochrome/quinol oxidase subunit 3
MSDTRFGDSGLDVHSLPVGVEEGHRPLAWWGTMMFIATESTFFAALLSSYFFVRANSAQWPVGGVEIPPLNLAIPNTVLLLSSSAVAIMAERALRSGARSRFHLLSGMVVVMGALFVSVQMYEWSQAGFTPSTNVYGSLFYTITGFHGLHVIVGLVFILTVSIWDLRHASYNAERHLPVRLSFLYWHFVDIVWIFVFGSLYVFEHLAS